MPTLLNAVKQALSVLILSLFIPFFSFSQASLIQWQKCLGGTGYETPSSIVPAADGGYAMVGTTTSNDGDVSGLHGRFDIWVVKATATGDIQWQKCFGGSGLEYGYCIKATADGGYIIAGSSESVDGDLTGNKGGSDVWLVKIDGNGALQWQKNYGGSKDDYAYSVDITADGGYIVGASSASGDGDVTGNHDNPDFWIFKTDPLGNIVWQKAYGGHSSDIIYSIIATSDGNYVAAGYTGSINGDVSGTHGGTDCWLIKLDADGNLLWKKCYGGSKNDKAQSIHETTDGGYIIAANSASTDGDVTGISNPIYPELNNGWVFKIDTAGAIQWQKSIGGSFGSTVNYITLQKNGYVIGGRSYSFDGDSEGGGGMWLVCMDAAGKVYRHYQFYGTGSSTYSDEIVCILPTADNGAILLATTGAQGGMVTGNHGEYSYDFWFVKLIQGALPLQLQNFTAQLKDGKGVLQWQTATEINTGYFNIERSSNGKDFITVGKVKAAGNSTAVVNYSYVDNLPAGNMKQAFIYYRLQEVDKNGNSYLSKTIALNTGAKNEGLIAWPNPVKNQLTIQAPNYTGKLKLSIYTMAGKKVMDANAANGTAISITTLPAGVYVISTEVNGKAVQQKFVKE